MMDECVGTHLICLQGKDVIERATRDPLAPGEFFAKTARDPRSFLCADPHSMMLWKPSRSNR